MISKSTSFETNNRQLRSGDEMALKQYCSKLSSATRSRFGPHSFDHETLSSICAGQYNNCTGYIAVQPQGCIIAYTIIKNGYLDFEVPRLSNYGFDMDFERDYTLAPSVADHFQSKGIGSDMLKHIIKEIKSKGGKRLVLWGGVQKTNTAAIRFYSKFRFRTLGEFEYHGLNLDMSLDL